MIKRILAIMLVCCIAATLTACANTPQPTLEPLPGAAAILKRCMGRFQYTADTYDEINFVKVEEQTHAQVAQLLPGLEGLATEDVAVFREKEGEETGFYCLIKVSDREGIQQILDVLRAFQEEAYPDEERPIIDKWNDYVYCFLGHYGNSLWVFMNQVLMREADTRAMPTWRVD
ncbi:MAG: hypothetical protein FWD16_04100 [Clostridia bacterium]|nr:hypothetical protein [Clostridia bacterium]